MARGCVAGVWSAEASCQFLLANHQWCSGLCSVSQSSELRSVPLRRSLASPSGGAWTLHTGERPRLSSLNVDILRPWDLQSWFCCPLGHRWDPGQTVSL